MNELKYNLYFTQLLLNIKEQKEIKTLCENINKELSSSEENDCKIIFLSQFTDNTIKLFQFNTIQEVAEHIKTICDAKTLQDILKVQKEFNLRFYLSYKKN